MLLEILVFGHVAKRIEMNEAGHRRDNNQHNRRHPVHPDGPIGAERAALNKPHDLDFLGYPIKAEEHNPRQERRQE